MHTACFWNNLQYYFNLCFTPIWYLGVRVYVLYNVYVIIIYLRVPVSKTILITNDGGMFWQQNDECHYEIMNWLESSAFCLVKHYIIISDFVLFWFIDSDNTQFDSFKLFSYSMQLRNDVSRKSILKWSITGSCIVSVEKLLENVSVGSL